MWGGDYFNMQELEPQRNLPQIYADHRRLKTTPLTTKDTKEHGRKAASKNLTADQRQAGTGKTDKHDSEQSQKF
jgi:hypothetical protein